MASALTFLSSALQKRVDANALRKLIYNPHLVDFCSNDYLGFARSPELAEIIKQQAIPDMPNQLGATGSRLLNGHSAYIEELENKIARFHKAEAALVFNSGYDANLGLFSCVPQRGDTFIYDELVHASIHDGRRLCHADTFMFKHNDLTHLEQRLQAAKGNVFVAVESVYSMDGDFAPLAALAVLCNQYKAHLIVDEAHATGVFGLHGEGRTVELGLEEAVFARIYTFGKALGCHGAAVVGSNILRSYLINFARSFIYTTALPVHSLMAIDSAYAYLQQGAWVAKMAEHINYFKQNMSPAVAEKLIYSESPIQCVVIPGNDAVKRVAKTLQEQGLDVRPILSPTVQQGKERLRICLHLFNKTGEMDLLADVLNATFN